MSTVREAVGTDEYAVYSLAASFSSPASVDRADFHNAWNDKLSGPGCFVGLAESEGSVVGYFSAFVHATLYADKPVAWVDEIFVREDMRNIGIGRRLMDEISRWAKAQGCRMIALASREGAEFYRALGYQEDASRYYRLDLSD